MKNLFILIVIILSSNLVKANWDSPEFLTQQSSSAIEVQKTLGDIGVIALNVLALGLIAQKEDGEGFREYLYSGITASTLVLGGKYLISRPRPDGSNRASMPSGHSAFSFMAASFITKRYGNQYALPTYLTSTFVAYSRVASQKHYVSDVLVGSFLGIAVGSFFAKNYNVEIGNNKYVLNIVPHITKRSFNIQLNLF